MKGIRRSLNKDKIGAPTPTYSTRSTSGYPSVQRAQQTRGAQSTTKNNASQAAAPSLGHAQAPPKMVIRALSSYRAQSPAELSFSEGDFFHVVSDQGGQDWFDASNPLTGARGLVPAQMFQVLGRNAKDTPAVYPTKGGGIAASTSSSTSPMPGPSSSRPTSSKPKSQPLYGVVQYDFVAERADELDAKRGEPIIVIAQSNHEWFVAKPIGRLGGPGLIPVAFVEIQDVTTGKPVENVEELIRSAVVPKVEEWKKMTADYKSASIPLGKFDFAEPAPAQAGQQQLDDTQFVVQGGDQNGGYQDGDEQYDENALSYEEARNHYGLVVSASVENFHQEEGSFWFHMRAFFSTGASLVLYRLYSDFHEFQMTLMNDFPVEAGYEPASPGGPLRRTLPMMPGPTDHEDEVICAQRVHDLSIYLAEICELPEHIRLAPVMYQFLLPRPGDVEVPNEAYQDRSPLSGNYGDINDYIDSVGSPQDDLSRGMQQMDLRSPTGSDPYQSLPNSADDRSYAPGRSNTTGSSANGHTQPRRKDSLPPMGNANMDQPFIKIKTFHRNTDDLIAIRVPPTVKYQPLLDKIRERLGSDVTTIRFREEVGSYSSHRGSSNDYQSSSAKSIVMAGGAKLVPISDDYELERWIRSGAKLVLYAD